jgi:hypothetical protein
MDCMAIVVFLRGANVGGHRRFRPSLVAKELQHFDVVNVGAAGLLVVRNPGSGETFRRGMVDGHIVAQTMAGPEAFFKVSQGKGNKNQTFDQSIQYLVSVGLLVVAPDAQSFPINWPF